MRNFRWSNVPIPQSHVIFLLLGMALHLWFPLKAFEFSLLQQVLGWLLLVLFAAWLGQQTGARLTSEVLGGGFIAEAVPVALVA